MYATPGRLCCRVVSNACRRTFVVEHLKKLFGRIQLPEVGVECSTVHKNPVHKNKMRAGGHGATTRAQLSKKVSPKRNDNREMVTSEARPAENSQQRLAELVTLSQVLQSRPVETCQHGLADLLTRVRYLGAGHAGFVFEEQAHTDEQHGEEPPDNNTLVAVKQVPVRRPEQVAVLLHEILANVRANQLVQFGVSPNFVLLFAAFVCNPACESPARSAEVLESRALTRRSQQVALETLPPYVVIVQELAAGALFRLNLPGLRPDWERVWLMSVLAQVIVGGIVPLNVVLGWIHNDLNSENVFYKSLTATVTAGKGAGSTSDDVVLHYRLRQPVLEEEEEEEEAEPEPQGYLDLYVRTFGYLFEVGDFGEATPVAEAGTTPYRKDLLYFLQYFALRFSVWRIGADHPVAQWVDNARSRASRQEAQYWDNPEHLVNTVSSLFGPLTLDLFGLESVFQRNSHPPGLPVLGPFWVSEPAPAALWEAADKVSDRYSVAVARAFTPLHTCEAAT